MLRKRLPETYGLESTEMDLWPAEEEGLWSHETNRVMWSEKPES
jgi:hypothetical protein